MSMGRAHRNDAAFFLSRGIEAHNALPDCTPAQMEREMQPRIGLPGVSVTPPTCKREPVSEEFPLAMVEGGYYLPCTRKFLDDWVGQRAVLPVGAKTPHIPGCRIENPEPYLCDHPAVLGMHYLLTEGVSATRTHAAMQSWCRETLGGPMITEVICEGTACLQAQRDHSYCLEQWSKYPVRTFHCVHLPGCPPPIPTIEEIQRAGPPVPQPSATYKALSRKLDEAKQKCEAREREWFLQYQKRVSENAGGTDDVANFSCRGVGRPSPSAAQLDR